MALPLPKVVADVGPGGPFVTAMGGMNSLANDMLLRQMNQIKKQYLPTTMQAEAASKLAYANLMGPQFLAKIMGNDSALANMNEEQKRAALQKIYQAGSGQGGINAFNQMQGSGQIPMGVGQPSTNNLSGWISNALKGAFGSKPQNSMNSPGGAISNPGQSNLPAQAPNPLQQQADDGIDHELDAAYLDWMNSPEGSQDGAVTPSAQELIARKRQKDGLPPKTYAQKTGEYKGTVKQGEEAGKYRAEAQKEIGASQLGLSHSGAVLDRMTGIIKNPVFQGMRNKFPFFQDKQLSYLMKKGTPEEKKLIGDFMSTAESFIASTVQGFSGKPLVREFDLAQRQKITPSDPVHVAEGKLRAAIALHDIAEKKNDIISDLLNQGVNEADAVKQANKMVDVSAIERQTEELLRDKPTEEDIKYMAQKRGISVDEVKKRLKAKGIM